MFDFQAMVDKAKGNRGLFETEPLREDALVDHEQQKQTELQRKHIEVTRVLEAVHAALLETSPEADARFLPESHLDQYSRLKSVRPTNLSGHIPERKRLRAREKAQSFRANNAVEAWDTFAAFSGTEHHFELGEQPVSTRFYLGSDGRFYTGDFHSFSLEEGLVADERYEEIMLGLAHLVARFDLELPD